MFPDEFSTPQPQSGGLDELIRGQRQVMAAISQLAKNMQLQAHAMTALAQSIQSIGEAIDALSQPKRILRDQSGKIIGIEHSSTANDEGVM